MQQRTMKSNAYDTAIDRNIEGIKGAKISEIAAWKWMKKQLNLKLGKMERNIIFAARVAMKNLLKNEEVRKNEAKSGKN
jgi:hypothetical protein